MDRPDQLVGLVAVGLGAGRAVDAARVEVAAAQLAAPARQVTWSDYATGLVQARQAGKPVLATFVTSWCGYSQNEVRTTWKAPAVAARLADTIPVRIDVEDEAAQGPQLAERYGIRGYPVQLLLNPPAGSWRGPIDTRRPSSSSTGSTGPSSATVSALHRPSREAPAARRPARRHAKGSTFP